MYIVLTILAELIFVSLLIILFYRLKPRFGLAPLYILLGTNQYFQTVLASSFYINFFGELSISPGSIILFSSSLFAILFIYIKEGVRSTQVLIMGIVLANLSVTFLASITHLQETVMQDIIISSGTAPDFFITNFRIFFTGTVTLILDAFIMVILYEFFFTKVRGLNLFTRLLITMLVVLNFDAVVFVLGSFWGSADLGDRIVSQLVSKSAVAVFFAAVLYFYLYYLDNERNNADVKEKKGKEDIFSILTYKGKFEKLKTEKTISDGQLQKSITDKTEELKNSVRRFTILSSVHELRVDKFSSAEQASEFLKKVKEAFEIDACTIHLLKDEKLIMLSSVGIEKNEQEEILVSTTPYFKEIISKKKCLAIEDTGKNHDLVKGREMGLVKFNYLSCIGAPLLSGNKVIGVIKLYSRIEKRVFTAIEIEHFQSVARQIANTIENTQLYEQNEKHKEVLVKQIVARKIAMEETLQSNNRFELIGKAANDAVWEWNLETNEFWGNEIHMNLYGLTRNDPEPGDDEWKRRLHEDDRERLLQTIDDAVASDVNSFDAEYRLFTENKGWINIYGRNYIERNAAGKAIRMLGSMMDITERKKAEEEILYTTDQLRQLTAHLQTIREEERKRIGREIHDELGQQLTAIKMDTVWIDKQIPSETVVVKEKLQNILELLDGSNESVRKILNELRPGNLENQALTETMEWQSRQFTESTAIPVKFTTTETSLKLSEETATCIFRVYQESLTNIIRYANASKVITSLYLKDDDLLLTIEDDGVGFDTSKIKDKKTFGLLGMKERVLSLNGKFELVSAIGKGTKIVISLPYKNT